MNIPKINYRKNYDNLKKLNTNKYILFFTKSKYVPLQIYFAIY